MNEHDSITKDKEFFECCIVAVSCIAVVAIGLVVAVSYAIYP